MKNKLIRKGLVIGVILLFLCSAYMPVINAEANSYNSKSIKSSVYNSLDNYKDKGYKIYIFAYLRVRGLIRDLEILGEYSYHFNTTYVVTTAFVVGFFGFIPIPFYNRTVSIDDEWDFNWWVPGMINKEKITENHIDFIAIEWGEMYKYP